MASFRYSAKDKMGRTVAGLLDSQDEKSLVELLRKQDLVIVSVREEKKKEKFWLPVDFGIRVRLSELVLFSRQLATMIESGIPLVQALEILTEQIEHHVFKGVVGMVKKDVAAGLSFHDSLAKHPRVFSPLFVSMVKAGESSGALDDIMDRLASYLEKTDSLIRKVKSALSYPIMVTLMAIGITLTMILKIVPAFKSIYADFGGQLPLPTLILIGISDLFVHYFFIWISVFFVTMFLLIRFLRTEKGTLLFDKLKLHLPVFGPILRKVAISKFCRTLATLVKSGVPILTALEIVGKTAGNKIIERAVDKVRISIREGENITDPLMRTRVFPPLVVRMISVGEQTGELEKMLTKIADFYDDQIDAAVQSLTSLIEPLVIGFLGLIIGSIVICMFMPIFQLASLVGKA